MGCSCRTFIEEQSLHFSVRLAEIEANNIKEKELAG